MEMKIGERKIGQGHPVFIVAEISGNHDQKFEKAVEIVRAAATAGADAVKLQTYTPDTITFNSDKEWFRVGGEDNPDLWKGKTLYQLYQTAYTPWDWQPKLKKLANDLGLMLFSTPFDDTAVDFLEKMNVPCYKIASYEATDFLLLRKIAQTKKPVIMSIGYATRDEAEFAVKTLREYGAGEIAILHCVTGYSDKPRFVDMNLKTIDDIGERFKVVSGFSDNNAGIEIPVMATLAGASIVEKHFIISRKEGGPDAQFSLEPDEFKEMVRIIRTNEAGKPDSAIKLQPEVLGEVHYGPVNELEEYNRRWRRSLFAVENIKKGEIFTKGNVRSIRPAFGLETRRFDQIIGKVARTDIEAGTPLNWDLIK